MEEAKNTQRSIVRLSYDGKVYKTYLGDEARSRFENECRVLRHLEQRGCNFVPRIIEADDDNLRLIMTNCGSIVDRISTEKQEKVFAELKSYGVRHDDAESRNLTYRRTDGRFCVIDFEFAEILNEEGEGPPPIDLKALRGAAKTQRQPTPPKRPTESSQNEE